jgi:nucleoside-diphosphate-sugar epimerase
MPGRIASCFITGATGFIGARLVEVLRLHYGTDVCGLVRDYTRLPRVARFPLKYVFGDLLDRTAIDRGVAGSDVVFHCAHDFADEQTNLAALKHLIDRALAHRVSRFVYLSSMAAYSPYPDGDLDEAHPTTTAQEGYARTKADCERLILRYVDSHGLPAVILQPSGVYGPYAPTVYHWIRSTRQCRLVIPEHGGGLSNLVYVDDLVQAMIRAALRPGIVGERFLISGPEPIPWKEHFRKLEEMAGVRTVVHMPAAEIEAVLQNSVNGRARRLLDNPRQLLKWIAPPLLVGAARRLLGRQKLDAIKRALPLPLTFPKPEQFRDYRTRCHVRIERARAGLGYCPRFNYDAGMQLTAAWVAWAGL